MEKVNLEDLLVSYHKLGTVYMEMGDARKALYYFEIYRNMSEEQSKINPNNFFLEKNFSLGYFDLSSAYQELGDWEKALKCAQTFKNMSEILSGKYPESELIKYQLAESYEMLGNINKKELNFNEALALFEKSLKIKELLYKVNPVSERLGDMQSVWKDKELLDSIWVTATNRYSIMKKVKIFIGNYLADPLKLKIKNNLALIISSLGHVHTKLGNTKSALKYYIENLQLSKELFNTDPNNLTYQDILITACIDLGELYKDMGYLNKALRNFLIANSILVKICEKKQEIFTIKTFLYPLILI